MHDQVLLPNAPWRTFSWSGDKYDKTDSNSSNPKSLASFMGAKTQPEQRNKKARPKFRLDASCCFKCESMTGTPEGLDALLSADGYKHYNRYELEEAADLGCALCAEFWKAAERGEWDYDVEGSSTRAHIRIFATVADEKSAVLEDAVNRLQFYRLEVHIPFDVKIMRVFFPVTFESDPASHLVPGRRESSYLSTETVNGIQRWLENCIYKHPSCPRRYTPRLPQRVLDVGTQDSSVRLHEPQKGEKARYAALSYCWGPDAQHYITTTSNLLANKHALPNNPPKTISDAIEVCRSIGIRYLWVDALCIIQDDSDDKLEQIANMGSIYKNSTVTIIAACAEKVTDGFLSNKKFEEPKIKLPFFIDDNSYGTIYLRQKASRSEIYSVQEPIFQRAWALQELLLSPRVLIFNGVQITTKCREVGYRPVLETHLAFESQSFDLPPSIFGPEGLRFKKEKGENKSQDLTQDRLWASIIHEYSDRDLALFDDRLPALAGIATELAKVWNDTYIAGFWGRSIITHLAWHRSQPRTRNPNRLDWTKQRGSPSWSWAAAPFPVHIGGVSRPDAKLVNSIVQLVSHKAPFGQVRHASIVLEARSIRALDLDLSLEHHFWTTGVESDKIELDYKDPKPDLEDCKLVYLGEGNGREIFLAVEMLKGAESLCHRVGYVELWRKKEKAEDLLSSTRRERVTIE